MMRSFIYFCKNAQTTLTCSVVFACLLTRDIDLRSSRRSKPQLFRIIARPGSDQLKVCSDILSCSRGSGSSLVFPTLTLVRDILLQAAASRK